MRPSLLTTPRSAASGAVLALCMSLLPTLWPATVQATTTKAPDPQPTAASAPAACPPLLRQRQPRLQDEKPVDLCQYAGRVLLVVNTASYCGYTGQYKALEALHARYRDQGLVVLGFPSNDFEQEPGSNAEIAAFCESTFGVKFPMFAKSRVAAAAGAAQNPLIAQLARTSGQSPRWNFHKYLVGRNGAPVMAYGSAVNPQDPGFVRDLEKLLKAKAD